MKSLTEHLMLLDLLQQLTRRTPFEVRILLKDPPSETAHLA